VADDEGDGQEHRDRAGQTESEPREGG
jgi:hypothetical protein